MKLIRRLHFYFYNGSFNQSTYGEGLSELVKESIITAKIFNVGK
jgi:hypothetical protein